MATTSDADAPRCPSCSYELTGLEALTCPECGTALERDFSRYRPSARHSPWVAVSPLRIWRSVPIVLFRPGLAFDRCRNASDLSARGSIAFALILSLLTILPWGAWRELAVWCEFASRHWSDAGASYFRDLFNDALTSRRFWIRLMQWESGSLLRLWLLFAILMLLVSGPRRDVGMALRRLFLFDPWLIVLELTFLFVGAFVCRCVPEPSTLFYSDWQSVEWKTVLFEDWWLKRALVPSFVIGVVFFRYVILLRWRMAAPLGLLVYPLITYLTILWSGMYLLVILWGK